MSGTALFTTAKAIEIPITIRFGDTDPYGVVYFASYFRYCHHGIEEFLRHLGLPPASMFRNQDEGFGLPIVGASCDFRRPVKYGEEIILAVSVVKMSNKALTFGFRFLRPDREEVVAEGQATLVAIGPDWLSRALPDRLREAIGRFIPPTA
jgi:acyl-CoA thioester hydrolase